MGSKDPYFRVSAHVVKDGAVIAKLEPPLLYNGGALEDFLSELIFCNEHAETYVLVVNRHGTERPG